MRATPVSGLMLSLGEHPPWHPQELIHSSLHTPDSRSLLSSMPSQLMALRTLTYFRAGTELNCWTSLRQVLYI